MDFIIVWSIKILYNDKRTSTPVLMFLDTNQIQQIDDIYKAGVDEETLLAAINDADFYINEDELTRSFTTDTNFNTKSVFNAKALSTRSCKGYTRVSKYNSEGKKIVTKKRWHGHFAHRTDFDWEGGNDTTIPEKTYWSPSVFANNSGISLYRILRNSSCAPMFFRFNSIGDYLISKYEHKYEHSDVYSRLKDVSWISHRTGINSSASAGVQLAQYMNNTAANQKYIGFMEETAGTPRSAYSDPYWNTNQGSFTETVTLGGTGSRDYVDSWCDGPNNHHDTTNGTISNSSMNFNVGAYSTYKASSHSNLTQWCEGDVRDADGAEAGDIMLFTQPSPVLSFYPTYKMYYSDELGEAPDNSAWVLAYGKREAKFTDYITIQAIEGKTQARAPWSRDRVDRENEKGYPVDKAGMAIRAVADDEMKIQVDCYFHIQDPAYSPGAEDVSNRSFANMLTAFNQIYNKLIDPNSYGFYSNLWEASSSNAPECYYVKPSKSWAHSESPKTRLESNGNVNVTHYVTTNYYVVDGKEPYSGSFQGNHGTITLSGRDFYLQGRYFNGLGNVYAKSDQILNSVLEFNNGTTKSWYSENYEGIALAHIQAVYYIKGLEADYAQVHSQLSDWVTKMNELAEALPYQGDASQNVIEEGDFGIGTVANIGSFTWPGNYGKDYTWNNVYPTFTPYLFGIRGSVYDLNQ